MLALSINGTYCWVMLVHVNVLNPICPSRSCWVKVLQVRYEMMSWINHDMHFMQI